MIRRFFVLLLCLPIVGVSTAAAEVQSRRKSSAAYKHAVVVADHPAASAAGIEVMRKGGNVVDAAVATAFTLSVVRPESCGIGGGGFMVIWNAEKRSAVALDYRERAPKRATEKMFVDPRDPRKSNPTLSRRGHLAVAVPGSVAGWCYAQKHYGKLKLADVIAPALRLASKGVVVDPVMQRSQSALLKSFKDNPALVKRYSNLHRLYLNGGKRWKKGDRFHSPQATVLRRIARHGRDGFYKGPVAEAIVAEMRRGGGLISLEDLASMQPVVRKPLRGTFDGYDILTMPPPSSGGVALLQMLQTLTEFEKRHPDQKLLKSNREKPAAIHLQTELMKHAFADRAEFLGDADFANVPIRRLLNRKYAEATARRIDPARTFPPKYYGRFQGVEDAGTSHFCVMDAAGNAVACTETVNLSYGSWVVEPKFGILLNDEMDDFAALPGQPNGFGLIQSKANAVAAGKKPLSSMTPTIAVKDGKAVYVVGASGGPRIITSTFQALVNMVRFGMSPAKAVSVPRFHHQWLPDAIVIEDPLRKAVAESLRRLGHKVVLRNGFSATQAASRQPGGLRGGSDPRKHGQPAGF